MGMAGKVLLSRRPPTSLSPAARRRIPGAGTAAPSEAHPLVPLHPYIVHDGPQGLRTALVDVGRGPAPGRGTGALGRQRAVTVARRRAERGPACLFLRRSAPRA